MAIIGPEIGTFILLACLNHVNKASSLSSYTAVRNFFLSGLNLDLSYTTLRFSLFFRIVLTVLLGRPNESAIADFGLVPSSTASIIATYLGGQGYCFVTPASSTTIILHIALDAEAAAAFCFSAHEQFA